MIYGLAGIFFMENSCTLKIGALKTVVLTHSPCLSHSEPFLPFHIKVLLLYTMKKKRKKYHSNTVLIYCYPRYRCMFLLYCFISKFDWWIWLEKWQIFADLLCSIPLDTWESRYKNVRGKIAVSLCALFRMKQRKKIEKRIRFQKNM